MSFTFTILHRPRGDLLSSIVAVATKSNLNALKTLEAYF